MSLLCQAFQTGVHLPEIDRPHMAEVSLDMRFDLVAVHIGVIEKSQNRVFYRHDKSVRIPLRVN